MKRIFTLVGLAVCAMSQAQMTVRPNTNVYVNDVVLYVDQGLDIQANSNLYMRREAQLLQSPTKALSTNSGTGHLSVFQEGTSDEFDYNYWCAPVGVADGTSGNRPFSLAQLYRPTTLTASTIAATTSGLNGLASPLTISAYWIWTFVASTDYAEWVHAGTGNINPGLGFTMKGTDGSDATNIYGDGVLNQNAGAGQRYDFRGRPNDGNVSVTVAPAQWTLTGNPYPSALFVDAFLLDTGNATAIRGEAYYWEHNKAINSHFLADYEGGYGTYVPGTIAEGDGVYTAAMISTYNPDGSVDVPGSISTGLSVSRDYAPIGQGFMVEGLPASTGTATFRNSHRAFYRESLALSHFERPALGGVSTVENDARLPHLRLNATVNNSAVRELALILVPFATDGVDRGLDGRSPNGDELPMDVAFKIGTDKYVIQGVAFDVTKRLPLIVKSTDNASFRFNMPNVINFDESQDVFIYDAFDNSYHNITNGQTYEVTVPTGTHANRFEVTFQDSALGVPTIKTDSMSIVQNNDTQNFTISNPNGATIKSCSLYDMAGKLIMNKEKLGSQPQYDFSTQGYAEGVYIVKVVTDDKQDFGQKISVHRPRQ